MGIRKPRWCSRDYSTTPIAAPDENPRPPLFIYRRTAYAEKQCDEFPARSPLRAKKSRTSAPNLRRWPGAKKVLGRDRTAQHGGHHRMSGLRAVVPTGSLAGRGVRFRAPLRARGLRRGGGRGRGARAPPRLWCADPKTQRPNSSSMGSTVSSHRVAKRPRSPNRLSKCIWPERSCGHAPFDGMSSTRRELSIESSIAQNRGGLPPPRCPQGEVETSGCCGACVSSS